MLAMGTKPAVEAVRDFGVLHQAVGTGGLVALRGSWA